MSVSVIIPAYNASKYLSNAVESVFQSGLKDFEILIINDGSTDNTETVAGGLSEQFDMIQVISQNNCGASAARNIGIQEASGDYVFFMDADDCLISGSLADVNAILEKKAPDMFLFGMLFDYYMNGKVYRSDKLCYPTGGMMSSEVWAAEYEALFASNMLSPVWNKLIRRNLILKHKLSFHQDMIEMEDYLFSAQCLMHCNQIYIMDKVAYRYRQAEDERGTFNRLWRIRSLSEYMKPFYEAAEAMETRFSKKDQSCNAVTVTDQIYTMLFHEQLRFAKLDQIRLAAQDMLSGKYPEVIAASDPKLFHKLKERQYICVWLERMLGRVRHQAAVQVKYRRSLKKRK